MIEVSSFNSVGIQVFKDLIAEKRITVSHSAPAIVDKEFVESVVALCFDKNLSSPLQGKCEIAERQSFQTRFEVGKYLHNQLPKESSEIVPGNDGLWTWISALYFGQLLESKSRHSFKLWSEYRYIFLNEPRRFYRHLVFTPFWIYRTRGEDVAKFFVSVAPHTGGDAVEQLYSRVEYFVQIPSLVEAALELYVDPKTQKLKAGTTSKNKPGGAIRLAMQIPQQLSMTYDLSSMSKDEILDILPQEFDEWRS